MCSLPYASYSPKRSINDDVQLLITTWGIQKLFPILVQNENRIFNCFSKHIFPYIWTVSMLFVSRIIATIIFRYVHKVSNLEKFYVIVSTDFRTTSKQIAMVMWRLMASLTINYYRNLFICRYSIITHRFIYFSNIGFIKAIYFSQNFVLLIYRKIIIWLLFNVKFKLFLLHSNF